jgi:hypothetical protein
MSSSSATESAPAETGSGTNNNNNDSSTNNGSGNRSGNNRYRNQRPFRNTNTDNLRSFKGAIESLPVLGTKVKKTSQDFSKFTKAIHNYVLANFQSPSQISRTHCTL